MRLHEKLLLTLGAATSLGLLAAGGWLAAGAVVGGTGAYAVAIRVGYARPRLRMVCAYLYTLAFYRGIEWIVPALGSTIRDATLLRADRLLFGETPAVTLEGVSSLPLSEVLSACYLSYHLYLHGALAWGVWRRDSRLFEWVFTAFALGIAGYLFVPATGPQIAYPEMFEGPIVGGWMTAVSAAFIAPGTSLYDVFPSLHLLITLALLDYDWRHVRRRFWWALAPALGLAVSTMYLRYHYAVDLLAGVAVWAVARKVYARFRTER